MPGRDGNGPQGNGPQTGGGFGFCNPNQELNFTGQRRSFYARGGRRNQGLKNCSGYRRGNGIFGCRLQNITDSYVASEEDYKMQLENELKRSQARTTFLKEKLEDIKESK